MDNKNMTIKDIEALTQSQLKDLQEKGEVELLNIKEHDCYFIDLEGSFGYSVLVFKNNHHIYYANDYQLHHRSKTIEDLKTWYITTLNNKLFTESELMSNIEDYNEYDKKSYYVRNYWIMQFDRLSAFCIGEPKEEFKKAKENMLYCPACFCYVSDKNIIEKSNNFIQHIEKAFSEVKENTEVFRKMISYELANHEACITCDYTDALNALGLKFNKLTDEQKKIVKEELSKQIANYC